jgi:hypothetical protein
VTPGEAARKHCKRAMHVVDVFEVEGDLVESPTCFTSDYPADA